MRELAILMFQSLDGVMQSPAAPEEDPSGEFSLGGWAQACWQDVMAQVGREAMSSPYDMLLGRNTYNQMAGHFSQIPPGDPTADRLNRAKKYVVTSGADQDLVWQNSTALSSQDVQSEVLQLKQQDGPLLQVHGSWLLLQTLLRHQLVDEFRIWTFPIVLGSGKRLFEPGVATTKLQLLKTEPCPSGVLMQIYRKAD